jgi:hypothetical protein
LKLCLQARCSSCNSSCLRGRHQEDHSLRPPQGKKLLRHFNQYVGVVVRTCNLSYLGGIGRRIVVHSQPLAKT